MESKVIDVKTAIDKVKSGDTGVGRHLRFCMSWKKGI